MHPVHILPLYFSNFHLILSYHLCLVFKVIFSHQVLSPNFVCIPLHACSTTLGSQMCQYTLYTSVPLSLSYKIVRYIPLHFLETFKKFSSMYFEDFKKLQTSSVDNEELCTLYASQNINRWSNKEDEMGHADKRWEINTKFWSAEGTRPLRRPRHG
jgi:hypothetical protein